MAGTPATLKDNVELIEIDTQTLICHVLGESPFIANRLSQKAKQQLIDPGGRKNAAQRATTLKHDPIAEFRDSPYTIRDPQSPTKLGLMASSFKAAMASAALDMPGATKAKIGRLVYVNGDLTPLYGTPQLSMAIVRSADINKTPDVRTRAVLVEWAATIEVTYAVPMLRQVDVSKLLSAAGQIAGVGDWRPERGKGAFGRFRIVEPENADYQRIIATQGRAVQEHALQFPEPYDDETQELLSWYFGNTAAKGFTPTQLGSALVEQEEGEREPVFSRNGAH